MAGLDCCCKILKYLVFIVNFLTTLAGLALVVLAALGMTAGKKGVFTSNNDAQIFFWICIVLLILGLLMTLVGFLGCCGACRESQCMLGTYVTFMVIGLALTVTGGVMLHQHRDFILRDALDGVRRLFENVQSNPESANLLQETLRCCGARDFRDWDRSQVQFPASCCIEEHRVCQSPWSLGISVDRRATDNLYHKGCLEVTEKTINLVADNAPVLLGFVGLIQVLAFVFSLALCCAIRNNTYKAGYRP